MMVSDNTLTRLNALEECANMQSSDETFKEYETMLKHKILEEKHKYSIYYIEKENAYRSYLPDVSKPNKRRAIKRKTKEELEDAIISFYIEQEQNSIQNITLEDLFKKWLIYKRDYTSAKAKTIQEYVNDWNKFIRDTDLSKKLVKDITPLILIRFFRKLTKDREYTYKRISNIRSILNGIMSYAIEEEIIMYNPVHDVNLKNFVYKPVENQKQNVFSKEDTLKLLTYLKDIDNEPYALAIQLFFYLFIRIGELKAIRKEDIDLESRTIYLHTQAITERELNDDLTFSPRQVTISKQMKGNTSHGFRYQYLTDEAIKIITKALALNPDGEYLFEPNGKLMTTDSFNRKLKKYCEECNIQYHSSHKIRFYNASTSYLNGTDISVISKCMGHSEIATTIHYLRDIGSYDSTAEAFKNLGVSS